MLRAFPVEIKNHLLKMDLVLEKNYTLVNGQALINCLTLLNRSKYYWNENKIFLVKGELEKCEKKILRIS